MDLYVCLNKKLACLPCVRVFESVPISMPMLHTCSSYINSCTVWCSCVSEQCNTPITFCHTLVEGLQQTHTHTTHTSFFPFRTTYNTNGNQNTYRLFCFIDIKTCMRCDFISFFISLPIFFFPNFDELKLENEFFPTHFEMNDFSTHANTNGARCSLPLTEEKKGEWIDDGKKHIISLMICLLVRRKSAYVFRTRFDKLKSVSRLTQQRHLEKELS